MFKLMLSCLGILLTWFSFLSGLCAEALPQKQLQPGSQAHEDVPQLRGYIPLETPVETPGVSQSAIMPPPAVPSSLCAPALPPRPPLPVPAPLALPLPSRPPIPRAPLAWRAKALGAGLVEQKPAVPDHKQARSPGSCRPAASPGQENIADWKALQAGKMSTSINTSRNVRQIYPASLDATFTAVVSACPAAGLTIESMNSASGLLTARLSGTSAGTAGSVLVQLKEEAPEKTSVKIVAENLPPGNAPAKRLLALIDSTLKTHGKDAF